VLIFGFILGQYRRMTRENRFAGICFALAWCFLGTVILSEAADGLAILERCKLTYLPCFEESFELVFLLLFYTANLRIAEKAEL